MTNPWTDSVRRTRATADQAREAIREAGQRRRDALAELASARADLQTLCDAVAESGLLPKTQIADAAGIARSKLYAK